MPFPLLRALSIASAILLLAGGAGQAAPDDKPDDKPAPAGKAPAGLRLSAEQEALLKRIEQLDAQLKQLEQQGKAKEGVVVARQLVDARQKLNGPKHVDTAWALGRLGTQQSRAGDRAAAQKSMEQALDIQRELFGDKHIATATSLNNLGLLFKDQGNYPKSREYFEQALTTYEQTVGPNGVLTAVALTNLGTLLADMGEPDAARATSSVA